MDKKEQDILNQIEEKTRDTEVPESLSPDAVQKMLGGKEKKRSLSPAKVKGLAAASIVLAAGLAAVTLFQDRGDKTTENGMQQASISESDEIATAKDYEEIYSYIEKYNNQQNIAENYELGTGNARIVKESKGDSSESAISESAVDSSAKSGNASASPQADHSTTNVRQEGVDEADTVKTDGSHLYVMKDDRKAVSIVRADNGQMEEIGEVGINANCFIEEFYLKPEQKKLTLVCSVTEEQADVYPLDRYYGGNASVMAVTYDLSDRKKPKETGRVTQSGSYSSSRMSGDYLYLFSTYNSLMEIDPKDKRSYVPAVNGEVLKSDDIYLPPLDLASMYEVITAVDIESPGEITDSKAIFTKGGEIYVSNENIYFYESGRWSTDKNKTTIRKISYKDGRLKAVAQGSFDGYINDSFSIDEHEGYLRVVATAQDTNSVYVLDNKLKITGSIEGLAKDERIYSARFMGDTGYFVTFRETDPLFSVDLSNPKKPKILGALKIPGFSDYLHFYGENQLLGIGMDVDQETQVTGGVKLTMFDISDKTDVKEASTYVLENVYSTDVSHDYKAAMIDPEKNIIGFGGYQAGGQFYYLFSYNKEEGFQCHMEERINGNAMMTARGIYIGEALYVIQGNIIESYSLKDYQKLGDIIL